MSTAVVLLNPKTPFNVGNAIRSCSIFGVPELRWTGERVHDNREMISGAPQLSRRAARLPRDERMKAYQHIDWGVDQNAIDGYIKRGLTPICVEIDDRAEQLPYFEHPEDAVYIFGPEDSSVGKGVKAVCHRFVVIPAASCLNLAGAVAVTLYDRAAKRQLEGLPQEFAEARAAIV
jgi:tRNA(Leu) C34 or U34 (ribose-2'-O)-methylase TrmL